MTGTPIDAEDTLLPGKQIRPTIETFPLARKHSGLPKLTEDDANASSLQNRADLPRPHASLKAGRSDVARMAAQSGGAGLARSGTRSHGQLLTQH